MEAIRRVKNLEHIKLAAIFVGLNMVDAALTWILAGKGGYELNPVTRAILNHSGWWAFWGFQIGTTLACVAALLFLASVFPRQMGKVFIALIIIFGGVCLFNLAGLLGIV